jgi:hypothetical protein
MPDSSRHHMITHMRGGALASVQRCQFCGWIDFADLDEQVRAHVAAEVERLQLLLDHAEQYARDLQDDGVLTDEAREQGIDEGRRQATWDAGDHALRGFAQALDESAETGRDLADMLDVLQLPANATPAQMLHGMSALVRSTLAEAFTDADIEDEETPDREKFVARVRRLMAQSYDQGDGPRRATEGWEREWGARSADGDVYAVEDGEGEQRARNLAAWPKDRPGTVASRLVGPWETAEQPESVKILSYHYGPTATEPDPGAMWCYACGGRVDLIDGHALCGCGAQLCESPADCGSSTCQYRPASGGVVEPSGPLTAEEMKADPGLHAHEVGGPYRDCPECVAKAELMRTPREQPEDGAR